MPSNLKEKIARILMETDAPVWFPDLAPALARNEWRNLKDEIGITPDSYGTARMIFKDAQAHRAIAFHFPGADESEEAMTVEILPATVAEAYRKMGVEFYSFDEILNPDQRGEKQVLNSLTDALDIVRLVPSLFSSVSRLAKSIHLINPEADDYDTSFSEPEIPFSIFVSVPRKRSLINSLRVAEAIVHEAMHLQLTLVEKIAVLVAPTVDLFYSPWKEEFRTPQGVLHALYVFRVIDCFLAELSNKNLVSPDGISHARRRRKEINEQIETIEDFADSDALTAFGKLFTHQLIEKVN